MAQLTDSSIYGNLEVYGTTTTNSIFLTGYKNPQEIKTVGNELRIVRYDNNASNPKFISLTDSGVVIDTQLSNIFTNGNICGTRTSTNTFYSSSGNVSMSRWHNDKVNEILIDTVGVKINVDTYVNGDIYLGSKTLATNPTILFENVGSKAEILMVDWLGGTIKTLAGGVEFRGLGKENLTDFVIKSDHTYITYTNFFRFNGLEDKQNNIEFVHNDNNTITINPTNDLCAIRQALKFRWYGNSWQIGNIRSAGQESAGFGFVYNNNKLSFRVTENAAYVGNNRVLHTGDKNTANTFLNVFANGGVGHVYTYTYKTCTAEFKSLFVRHGKLPAGSFMVLYRKKYRNNRNTWDKHPYKRAYQILGPKDMIQNSTVNNNTTWSNMPDTLQTFEMGYKLPTQVDNEGYYNINLAPYLHFITPHPAYPKDIIIRGMSTGFPRINNYFAGGNKTIRSVYVDMGIRIFTPNGKTSFSYSAYEMYDVSPMCRFRVRISQPSVNSGQYFITYFPV